MFDWYLADLSRRTIDQAVCVGIWTAIFDDFADHKTIHHFETGEIKIFWFVQHQRCNAVIEATTEIPEPGMFFFDVMPVNHVEFLALQFVQHSNDFFRRILTIIIEHRDVTTARLAETR